MSSIILKKLFTSGTLVQIASLGISFLACFIISRWRASILHLLRKHIFSKKIALLRHYVISSISPILTPLSFIIFNGLAILILESMDYNTEIIEDLTKIAMILLFVKLIAHLRQDGGSKFMISLILIIAIIEHFSINDIIRRNIKSIKLSVLDVQISLYTLASSAIQLIIMFWIISSSTRIGQLIIVSTRKDRTRISYDLEIRLFRYLSYFIGLIVSLNIIGIASHHIAMVGSALGIGIGIGLQRIAANFISGIMILTEKNIKSGDVVEIDGKFLARVKELGIRSTIVETQDGKSIIIPNEEFMIKSVTNVTHDNNSIRIHFNIVTSDLLRLDEVIQICKNTTKCVSGVSHELGPRCYVNNIIVGGAEILICFWVDDIFRSDTSAVKSRIIISVIKALSDHGIEVVIPGIEHKIISDLVTQTDLKIQTQ